MGKPSRSLLPAILLLLLNLLSRPNSCSANQALSDADSHNHTDHFGAAVEQSMRMKNIIDRLLQNYTRQNSPHGDKPTIVHLGIYINSFYSISEQTMDYSVNIYLRQQWYDPRLRFNKSEVSDNKDCVKLEDKVWEKLWVPDVFFRNEKKADFHHVTIPNRFINLYPDGKLWYVMKISATLSCMMQLQKYPLDTQICPMMLESFGHTMQTVIFKWLVNKSVESTDELSMPQFMLKGYPTKDCSKNYTTGSYPCLQVDFILQRDIGYFIIQVYIPTILQVILSWVAFWINAEAIPARVSLGLLTVLTMTTQSSGAGQSLPRVSYIKAIDVWMSVCLIFVFASLLEFAVVNVYSRKDTNSAKPAGGKDGPASVEAPEDAGGRASLRLHHQRTPQILPVNCGAQTLGSGRNRIVQPDEGTAAVESTLLLLSNEKSSPPKLSQQRKRLSSSASKMTAAQLISTNTARKIDKISRRLFPLMFLIFNVIYWVMYVVVK